MKLNVINKQNTIKTQIRNDYFQCMMLIWETEQVSEDISQLQWDMSVLPTVGP